MPITIWDLILAPFYLIFIYFIANSIKKRNIEKNPVYKYYSIGLWLKIFGGIAITLIYIFYYGGGDTTLYYHDVDLLSGLLFTHPNDFFRILFFGTEGKEILNIGNNHVWFWIGLDYNSFFFVRIATPISLLGFRSYLVTVILLAWIAYIGIWKLYLMFTELYPHLFKQLAFSILFVPSVIIWGSGLLKDTVTMSAVALFTYSFYKVFIGNNKSKLHFLSLFINAVLIILIKPYIFVALIPSCLVWLTIDRTKKITNKIVRFLAAPVIISGGVFLGIFILSSVGGSLGKYSSPESIMKKAQITQQDLVKGNHYGENYYDIGKFDNSFSSIASKVPLAIIAGLYRPFIWDVRNIIMLFSGLESSILLIMTIAVILLLGPFKLIRKIQNDSVVFFSIVFSLIFAFSVGLSTANYGALVRYRIPELPFFISSLVILLYQHFHERKIKQSEQNESWK